MSDTTDRRRAFRRVPIPGEPLRRVRSRTGHDLDLVDISDAGALVEGRARLLPNTHIDVHLVGRNGRMLVRCSVVRAFICHVEADLVRYRVGLAFDRQVDTSLGYLMPATFPREIRSVGTAYPDSLSEQAVSRSAGVGR